MTTQKRNAEMVELLRPDFQARYEPNFAWVNAVSAFLLLPGLRGFWPMSSISNAGNAYDLSGQGRTLTYTGNPLYNVVGLAPYIDLDGAGDYLTRADEADLDITGAATVLATDLRGLTMGGWFWIDSLAPGADDAFIGKWNTVGDQRSYLLNFTDASNSVSFSVSSLGTAVTVVTVTSAAITAAAWHFMVGRFDPSTEINVWVDNVEVVNAVGTPASIYSGTANLNIGAHSNGATGLLDGRASLCFLCAAFLPDAHIKQLWEQTRALYGV